MADVTGPIGSLPGAHHKCTTGATCDDCGAPAVKRIQGETDSFGSEMMDFCQACYDKWKITCQESEASGESMSHGTCDWCSSEVADRRAFRDAEEGQAGPVYWVCQSCRAADAKKWREEYDETHSSVCDYED